MPNGLDDLLPPWTPPSREKYLNEKLKADYVYRLVNTNPTPQTGHYWMCTFWTKYKGSPGHNVTAEEAFVLIVAGGMNKKMARDAIDQGIVPPEIIDLMIEFAK